MKRIFSLIIAMAASSAFAFGDVSYGNATANGGAAFGGSADTMGGNISSSIGGSAAANNIGGSATGNTGNVNGNVQTLTGNSANVTGGNVTGGSANVTAGSANVSGGNITGGDQTNNLNGSVTGGNITSGINGSSLQGQSQSSNNRQAQSSESRGNSTNTQVTVQGDTVESNTPPVVPGVLPSVPTSCRLYLFGGASTRDGAGSGTIPIGNDQTCLSIAGLNLMERAGGFTQKEKQAIVCKVEGISDTPTCKAINKKEAASTHESGEPTDPFIRRRLGLAQR